MGKKVTRREVIIGAAGLGALSFFGCQKNGSTSPVKSSAAANRPTSCNNGNSFNIILHGLFLIELHGKDNPDGRPIRILSPKTDPKGIGHVYRAGSWKNRQFTDFSGDCDSGWATNNLEPPIDGLPTIHKRTNQIDYKQSEFSIFLPWPLSFKPLRTIDASTVIHGGIEAQWFPLALALQYGTAPKDGSPIKGCDWDSQYNFHIFAEPPCKLTCDDAKKHGPEMVGRLLNMFLPPANLSLSQQAGSECKERDPDPCPPAPGVNRDEDKSLGELFPCGHPLDLTTTSVHLPLCASLFVTPT